METKLTIGKLKKFLADNSELSDDVVICYPHYYKGYGLMAVREIEKGKVPSYRGDDTEVDVVVLDWCTTLHTDDCFIKDTREVAKELDEKAKNGVKNEMS